MRGTIASLAALALAAMPGSAVAAAATAGVTANAVALRPLSIVKVDDLDFGSAIAGAAAGTIVINPTTAARSTTGGVTPASGTFNPAEFQTFGGPAIVLIQLGPAPVLNRAGGGATMTVTGLTLDGPILRFLPAPGLLVLHVGGTLAVGANQLDGSYSGTFSMTVTYF
ncbi:MAG: DUF4402 domain-containing protein [Sphingomonadaceae bacterium]|nr:DUF4402 domain-containing protein [Sphingomonadaceae bacterium]